MSFVCGLNAPRVLWYIRTFGIAIELAIRGEDGAAAILFAARSDGIPNPNLLKLGMRIT